MGACESCAGREHQYHTGGGSGEHNMEPKPKSAPQSTSDRAYDLNGVGPDGLPVKRDSKGNTAAGAPPSSSAASEAKSASNSPTKRDGSLSFTSAVPDGSSSGSGDRPAASAGSHGVVNRARGASGGGSMSGSMSGERPKILRPQSLEAVRVDGGRSGSTAAAPPKRAAPPQTAKTQLTALSE